MHPVLTRPECVNFFFDIIVIGKSKILHMGATISKQHSNWIYKETILDFLALKSQDFLNSIQPKGQNQNVQIHCCVACYNDSCIFKGIDCKAGLSSAPTKSRANKLATIANAFATLSTTSLQQMHQNNS